MLKDIFKNYEEKTLLKISLKKNSNNCGKNFSEISLDI